MQNNYSEPIEQKLHQKNCQSSCFHEAHSSVSENYQTENCSSHQLYRNPCKMDVPLHYCENKQPMEQIFKSLFGSTNVSDWQYSEASLQKALHVRVEQERTKQEYYKIERLNRVVELLKLASATKIPGHLIPLLIDSKIDTSAVLPTPETTPVSSSNETPASYSTDLSPSPVRAGHQRCKTVSSLADLQASSNISLINDTIGSNTMRNFKFGLGSSKMKSPNGIYKNRTSLPPKHQLSPSRIGARAVSSLNRNISTRPPNLMDLRHGKRHQRTLSLPASVTIPETKPMVFHTQATRSEEKITHKEIIIPDISSNSSSIGVDVDVLLNGTGYNNEYKLAPKSYIKSPLREIATSNENEIATTYSDQPASLTNEGNLDEPKTP